MYELELFLTSVVLDLPQSINSLVQILCCCSNLNIITSCFFPRQYTQSRKLRVPLFTKMRVSERYLAEYCSWMLAIVCSYKATVNQSTAPFQASS